MIGNKERATPRKRGTSRNYREQNNQIQTKKHEKR